MKVVIVGGGTAGWLVASYFESFNKNYQKNNLDTYKYEITVVDSDKVPIIGAGEGSTGLLPQVLRKFKVIGVNEMDFFYETDSTIKLAINFKDWNGIGTSYLSPIEPSATTNNNVDLEALVFKMKNKTHDAALAGYLAHRGMSDFRKNRLQHIQNHAYHFDAHKVGQYLKSICVKNGTKNITGHLSNVEKDINGNIKNIQLETGQVIEGDLFIDCSGFSRFLVKQMDMEWESYAEYLPVNAALPYVHQYKKNEQIMPETLAWAQNNGWMWQIPKQTQYGCGYVYCDNFITPDHALEELQKTTNRKIEPVRNLKFEVGRLKTFWKNNVVAIGLSSAFLEPLQATSIHTTLMQIQMMINYLNPKEKNASDVDITTYNNYTRRLIDEFRDLIQIHYITKRDDTDFWKFIKYDLKRTEKTKIVLETAKHRALSFMDFELYHGSAAWGVWGWTLLGLDIITSDVALKTIKKYGLTEYIDEILNGVPMEFEKQSSTMMNNTELVNAFRDKKFDTNTFNQSMRVLTWHG
jgi:tryptophan halogenase